VARSLFGNLGDGAPKPPVGRSGPAPVLTITQLAARIDDALRTGIPGTVKVVGQVSGFRDRTHWYFDLKDAGAVVNAVMFRSAAARAGFVPENGQEIVASGRVEFYAPGGKVSLILDKIEPVGAGALELAYRKLCAELKALGWFEIDRKRSLPGFPRKVAVVTSRSAAALQDVLVTMKKRCPAVPVLLADVRVQGEGAAEEVAAAIRSIGANHAKLGVDVILVTRGGGSMEDLWAFNERIVADAIVHCPIPVVAAIGHETDTTIAELVADERCATPTQAAMRLTPDTDALLRELHAAGRRLGGLLERHIRLERQRLAGAARHPAMADPARGVTLARQRLAEVFKHLRHAERSRLDARTLELARLAARIERVRPAALHATMVARVDAAALALGRAMRAALHAHADRSGSAERQLRAVGPAQVLERGYSVTLGPDGKAVRKPTDVAPGQRLRTLLTEGEVHSVVEGQIARPVVRQPERRSERRLKHPEPDTTPGLFGS
jgi:exodeoxyribonuclease VII large subunit